MMKKTHTLLLLLLTMIVAATTGFSQVPAPADFFVGRWKLLPPDGAHAGPKGEAPETLLIDIARKEGKLTVHLSSRDIINARVQDESATELVIVFDTAINPGHPTQVITAKDVHTSLRKVDNDQVSLDYMGAQLLAKRVP
jgi:hypothetical protein